MADFCRPGESPQLRRTPFTLEELAYARRELFDKYRGEHEVARELQTTRQTLMGALVQQQLNRREAARPPMANKGKPTLPERVQRANRDRAVVWGVG